MNFWSGIGPAFVGTSRALKDLEEKRNAELQRRLVEQQIAASMQQQQQSRELFPGQLRQQGLQTDTMQQSLSRAMQRDPLELALLKTSEAKAAADFAFSEESRKLDAPSREAARKQALQAADVALAQGAQTLDWMRANPGAYAKEQEDKIAQRLAELQQTRAQAYQAMATGKRQLAEAGAIPEELRLKWAALAKAGSGGGAEGNDDAVNAALQMLDTQFGGGDGGTGGSPAPGAAARTGAPSAGDLFKAEPVKIEPVKDSGGLFNAFTDPLLNLVRGEGAPTMAEERIREEEYRLRKKRQKEAAQIYDQFRAIGQEPPAEIAAARRSGWSLKDRLDFEEAVGEEALAKTQRTEIEERAKRAFPVLRTLAGRKKISPEARKKIEAIAESAAAAVRKAKKREREAGNRRIIVEKR